jgi:hypothetical protein
VYRLDGALMQDAALAGATNATNAVVLSSSLRMSHLLAPVPADAKQANGGDQARQIIMHFFSSINSRGGPGGPPGDTTAVRVAPCR